jgi:hypothetical protein
MVMLRMLTRIILGRITTIIERIWGSEAELANGYERDGLIWTIEDVEERLEQPEGFWMGLSV